MARVLYIEDDTEHGLMVSQLLTSRGFTVETARDGLEGVEKVRKWQPDVILLDLLLPHLDGFGVMNNLKQDPETQNIPIIVISAWPTADNRRRVKEAGAQTFIAKPFKADELVNSIQDSLPQEKKPQQ
jgi:two-component system sensor histidine kinase/response regulator